MELKVWLGSDNKMANYMTTGIYISWTEAEQNIPRIQTLHADDPCLWLFQPQKLKIQYNVITPISLDNHHRLCMMFLNEVAKCVYENHYTTVMRQALLLQCTEVGVQQN